MPSSYSRQQEKNAVSPNDVWILSSKGVLFAALIVLVGLVFDHLIRIQQLHTSFEPFLGKSITLVLFFLGAVLNALACTLALKYLFRKYLLVYEEVLLWLLVGFTFALLGSAFLDMLNHSALAGIEQIIYSKVFPISSIVGVIALLIFWKANL